MSFDEEYIDPHGECAAEIHRLQAALHAAESQLAAMGEALRNAACTCPLPYRAIKPEEHEESCLSLKVLSHLPERAKAWMGLREAAERYVELYGLSENPTGMDVKRALAALRALETGT